jgi:hypothetical protein
VLERPRAVRRFLGRRRWLPVATLAAVGYILGYFGYRHAGVARHDAFYFAFQLFALESPNKQIPDPVWYLEVARFAAPISAGWAIVQAVFALFSEQIQVLRMRLRARDHVVVAGLGSVGFGLAKGLDAGGVSVVAIEADPTNAAIASCRERGIAVVTGNAADPELLRKTRVARARHFVITCGNDMTNLDVALATTRVVCEPSSVTALVDLRDLALWRRLQAQLLMSPRLFSFRLDVFNVLDRAAEVLLGRYPPFPEASAERSGQPHVLFVGLEGVGEFAVPRIASRWKNADGGPDGELLITVIGPAAEAQVADLLSRYPELSELCRIESEDVAVGGARFQRGDLAYRRSGVPPVTSAYVCLLDETDGLTAALVLRGLPDTRAVPLVVTVWEEEMGVAKLIQAGSGRLAEVAEFGVLTSALEAGVSQLGVNEVIARLRHDLYVRWEAERGVTPATNPSMVPWDELPDSLKASNRDFADGVGRKLAAFGCVVVPAPLALEQETADIFTPAEIEELAEMEHERWMNDLVLAGWRRAPGPKDAVRMLHPLLVPWDELSEIDRERDRTAIRALPGMLARAGFEIQRVESGSARVGRAASAFSSRSSQ